MSAVLKPQVTLSRELLTRISEEVEFEHAMRLDVCQKVPMIPTGRTVKKRPRTAIISRAAQRAIEKREAQEKLAALTERFCGRAKP